MTAQKLSPEMKKLVEQALNYQDRESQLSDNMSNLDLATAAHLLGITQKKALAELQSGELGHYFSLEERSMTASCQRSFPSEAILWLSEEAINAYFDEKDGGGSDAPDGLESLSVEALEAILLEERKKAERKAQLIAEIRSLRGV